MSRFTLIDRRPPEDAPAPVFDTGEVDRREAIAWMSAGVSLALAGCGKPSEAIVPQVDTPPGRVTGEAERYATSLPLVGYGRGMIVTTHEGRPTKVEGDPRHPFSLGATDVFAEAEVLSLYDPARMRGVETTDGPADWSSFQAALGPRLALARGKGGEGLTVLTPRITSPTELRLIKALQAAMPQMAWRRFEPVNEDAADAGAELVFGRKLDALVDLAAARTLLCLDADPLGPGPWQLANARAYAKARAPADPKRMMRLYVAETGWSLTGMNADHRQPLRPEWLGEVAAAVANALGAGLRPARLPTDAAPFAQAVAADLKTRGGLVMAGRSQPPQVHALCHWINGRIAAPVRALERIDPHPMGHQASLEALFADLDAGRVETLIVIGGDPAMDAIAPDAERRLRKAPFLATAALHPNATTSLANWRLALAHPLESWGDLRAPDGSASLVQPMVDPLHDGRTAAEILAMLLAGAPQTARALVAATWSADPNDAAGETRFRQALSDGVVQAAPPPQPAPSANLPEIPPPPEPPVGFVLALSPDPTVYDGRYAENAWLQECPKPLTHEVWGASLAIAPTDAAKLGLKTGDHVSLRGLSTSIAVRVTPGQAVGAVSGFLGGGRRSGGPIADGIGVDLGRLRRADAAWVVPVTITRARGGPAPPAFATTPFIEGEATKLSPVVSVSALPGLKPLDPQPRPPSQYPDQPAHDPAWAMVIDANACIGCNACVVACQSENNVPVVGPHETARGRDMHWLRIDAYDLGSEAKPQPAFQPVPCMQCEHAPCEPVCPVEASVHDHEGLNDQVYNRCIGTRFCEANCPYKVRRFNFHGYAHEQAYENLGDADFDAQKNPDVTVRARGVMEKCTYCVQRISSVRRTAEKEGRAIRDGEVVTACQSACPTQAIHFGNLHDGAADVRRLRGEARHYALLGELGTRPRTTYLARLRNPNPALEPPAGGEA